MPSLIIIELEMTQELVGASKSCVQHTGFDGNGEVYLDFNKTVGVASDLHLLDVNTSGPEVRDVEVEGANSFNT